MIYVKLNHYHLNQYMQEVLLMVKIEDNMIQKRIKVSSVIRL